jgi:aldehyde:ferredoxin oxidoreductase
MSLVQRYKIQRLGIGSSEVELEKMNDNYYLLVGWDTQTGVPTRSKLDRFSLSDVAERLFI